MRPSQVLSLHRQRIRRVIEQHHASNARVFGSASRGDDIEGSDLDLLVDPLPGATLLDMGAIQVELEDALGVTVEILTLGDLPAKFRERALREAKPV